MALQLSDALRNTRADDFEAAVGTSGTLEIRSGSPPANCAAADSGTVLASISLPSDWMTAASGGVKSLSGTWQDASADATGTAGHFRFKNGATCHAQGTVTATGGGGDMTLVTTSITATQPVQITSFVWTEGNA